jgi:hypothetical protein
MGLDVSSVVPVFRTRSGQALEALLQPRVGIGEMRVSHIVPARFDVEDGIIGGGERYAFELVRFMANEVPTRFVAFGDRERNESIRNLDVRVIDNAWYVRGQRSNPIALALLSELRRADIVHCHQLHILSR